MTREQRERELERRVSVSLRARDESSSAAGAGDRRESQHREQQPEGRRKQEEERPRGARRAERHMEGHRKASAISAKRTWGSRSRRSSFTLRVHACVLRLAWAFLTWGPGASAWASVACSGAWSAEEMSRKYTRASSRHFIYQCPSDISSCARGAHTHNPSTLAKKPRPKEVSFAIDEEKQRAEASTEETKHTDNTQAASHQIM